MKKSDSRSNRLWSQVWECRFLHLQSYETGFRSMAGPNCSGVSWFVKTTSYLLIIRVTALVQGNLVSSLVFSMMPTPVWILLRGFFLDQPTPLAVLNATPPPLELQSKRSLTESILMSVARGWRLFRIFRNLRMASPGRMWANIALQRGMED